MPFMQFDRSRLQVLPLADREHDMHLSEVVPLDAPLPNFDSLVSTLWLNVSALRGRRGRR